MREISAKELGKLFTLIPVEPGASVFHIAQNSLDFIQSLNNYLISKEIEYDLMVTNTDFYNKLLNKLKKCEYLKIKELDLTQKRYNSHTKLYDMLFITVDLSNFDTLDILKKAYRVMKNAAYVIVVIPNELKNRILDDLESTNFVAINSIDISTEFEIISAKKLHGWKRV